MTLIELFVAYQEAVADALEISCILGYPDTSRGTVTLPIAALTILDEDYARLPPNRATQRRIGQTQPIGRSARASLYIYAANERALIGYVEALFGAKGTLTGLNVGETLVNVDYQPTQRQPFDDFESSLRYSVATEVLFNWST